MPIHLVVGQKATGDDFFDREDLMDSLWSLLPRQSVELVAPRRFGKSSVMARLKQYPRNQCLVHYIDCEAFSHTDELCHALGGCLAEGDAALGAHHRVRSATQWFTGVARGIKGVKAGPVGVDLAGGSAEKRLESVGHLLEYVRRRGEPTVVVLDEFSVMLSNLLRLQKLSPAIVTELLSSLRHLRQQQTGGTPLSFVFGGSVSMDYWLRRIRASAAMNDLVRLEVPAFDPIVARRFVTALLSSEGMPCGEGAVEAILAEIAPPVPYWIQLLVWQLRQDPACRLRVTAADVSRVYEKDLLGRAGRQYFQHFDERLDAYEPGFADAARRLLCYLASEAGAGGADRDTLATVYSQATGAGTADGFEMIMADLESDFYVRTDDASGKYVFAHKVLRDWWPRWHGRETSRPSGALA